MMALPVINCDFITQLSAAEPCGCVIILKESSVNALKRITFIVAIVMTTVFMFGISSCSKPESKGTISVASKIDTEGALLGTMIRLVLEDAGFTVNDKVQLGATGVVRKALIAGEIDVYPEYTGNAAYFHDEADSPVWKDAKAGWNRAKELDSNQGLVWLASAPANNTWAIAIRKDVADAASLRTMSELGRYLRGGGRLKLAGSEEFVTSAAALPAFQEAYGFTLRADQLLVLSGGNTAATEKAASDATDGVNAAMAYGTDGQLSAFNLIVLTDDRGVQPVYEPAPVIRKEVLDRHPEIEAILGNVFSRLDLVTLQTLNADIAVNGIGASKVAKDWLTSQGLLK